VFFGGDPGSPDTFQKFYADVEMYANNFDGTDPEPYLAPVPVRQDPGPGNQWQGENINRFCDPAYDALVPTSCPRPTDMAKRAEIAKKLNDMLTKDSMSSFRWSTAAALGAFQHAGRRVMNTWDTELWNVADWFRVK
jgi:peptide/nickel transport system substrate-binding protein